MSGDDVGPDSAVGVGGDLVGDVTFTTTKACADFNYGYGTESSANAAPTARIALRPGREAKIGQEVTFDGSESFDDRQAPGDLTYKWAFGDGATATGRTVRHAYAKAGTYDVTLTVTDADGASTTSGTTVTVSSEATGPGTIPTTGGSPALAVLAVLGSATAVLIRRRAALG